MNIASHITQSLASGGSSKRRLAGSSFGASSSNRDTKTRRRGDPARLAAGGSGAGVAWEGSKAEIKREERDLVDNSLVEYLRKGSSS